VSGIVGSPLTSPLASPLASAGGITRQHWAIDLRAFYTPPAAPEDVPSLPDLCHTLSRQAPARLWRAHLTDLLGALTLEYGMELVARSMDAAEPEKALSILAIST
jgi:hypothetical protein